MTLVTEKEAAEKWCPMFRAAIAVGPSDGVEVMTNRDGMQTLTSLHNCIGSRCMAFRWHDDAERVQYETKSVIKKPGEAYPPFSNLPDGFEVSSYGASYVHCRKEISREPRRGYCGAFGKVEP